jgi:putative ABC transport system permease protein
VTLVSPGWFAALGIPLAGGRDFSTRDTAAAPRVVVVNPAFVRAFLGGSPAIGRLVAFADEEQARYEIIGVAGDIVAGLLRDGATPAAYVALWQADGLFADILNITLEEKGLTLTVRAADEARGALARAVVDAAQRVDPGVGLTIRFPDQQIRALTTRERVLAMLSGFFGALALLLSAIGLYGVAAYAVARQRKEIALRMALGAAARSVVGLVLGRMAALIAIGVIAGSLFSLWAWQFVTALLYGVPPRDPLTLAGAIAVLLTVGLLVGWLPARRASRVDPANVLRYE